MCYRTPYVTFRDNVFFLFLVGYFLLENILSDWTFKCRGFVPLATADTFLGGGYCTPETYGLPLNNFEHIIYVFGFVHLFVV